MHVCHQSASIKWSMHHSCNYVSICSTTASIQSVKYPASLVAYDESSESDESFTEIPDSPVMASTPKHLLVSTDINADALIHPSEIIAKNPPSRCREQREKCLPTTHKEKSPSGRSTNQSEISTIPLIFIDACPFAWVWIPLSFTGIINFIFLTQWTPFDFVCDNSFIWQRFMQWTVLSYSQTHCLDLTYAARNSSP